MTQRRPSKNDYILTSSGMDVIPGSVALPEWAHTTKGSFHEPIMIDFRPLIRPQDLTSCRRKLLFDRGRLKDVDVQEQIIRELGQLSTPPACVEQSSRNFLLTQAIRSVLEEAAPIERKPRKHH